MTDDIILPSNSKAILLTQGKYAIVDAGDYDWLNQWEWHVRYGYAVRTKSIVGCEGERRRVGIIMHRFIMNTPDGMYTDHINGDKLDNRRCNLRIVTTSQNMMNQKKTRGNSKYKGVYWNKNKKKWIAQIGVNHKKMHVGNFSSEIAAAAAYNEAAKKYFGEFAKCNLI